MRRSCARPAWPGRHRTEQPPLSSLRSSQRLTQPVLESLAPQLLLPHTPAASLHLKLAAPPTPAAMAHRATNLRYQVVKLAQAAQEAAAALSSATASLPEALQRGLDAFSKPLTMSILIAGAAMAPTLNPKGARCAAACSNLESAGQHSPANSTHSPNSHPPRSEPDSIERLLVRLLPRPSERSVHAGDVVAFASPFTTATVAAAGGGGGLGVAAAALGPEQLQSTMVRRVAAMPGEELVAAEGEEDEECLVVPPGHCWVLADNEQLQPPHVIDSRSFGPLPLSQVIGRCACACACEDVPGSCRGTAARRGWPGHLLPGAHPGAQPCAPSSCPTATPSQGGVQRALGDRPRSCGEQ